MEHILHEFQVNNVLELIFPISKLDNHLRTAFRNPIGIWNVKYTSKHTTRPAFIADNQ